MQWVVLVECNNCKKSHITAKHAWLAICARATRRALLSKTSNLIGRTQISDTGSCMQGHRTPSFLLIKECGMQDYILWSDSFCLDGCWPVQHIQRCIWSCLAAVVHSPALVLLVPTCPYGQRGYQEVYKNLHVVIMVSVQLKRWPYTIKRSKLTMFFHSLWAPW